MEQTEEEPQVLVKPKIPIFLSPKFLAGAGILFLVLVAVLLNYTVLKKPLKPQPSPTTEVAKIILPCPTDPVFCQEVKPIVKDGRYLALGINVDPDSPIYAVFDGKAIKRGVSFEEKDQEGFSQITLVDGQKKLKAVYSLKKTATLGNLFKKGDIMGIISKDPIKFFGEYNLAFTLLDQNNQEIPYERIIFQ